MTTNSEIPAVPAPDGDLAPSALPTPGTRRPAAIPWRRVFTAVFALAVAALELACAVLAGGCAMHAVLHWGEPDTVAWLQGATYLTVVAVWLALF